MKRFFNNHYSTHSKKSDKCIPLLNSEIHKKFSNQWSISEFCK